MTGTSTRTPTTVANAAPRTGSKEGDRGRHGEFKEIAGSDQGSRRGDGMGDLQPLHQAVGERRVEVHLQQDWNSDQDDVPDFSGDVVRLKGENQDQGCEQRNHRDRRELWEEGAFEPRLPMLPDEPRSEAYTDRQGDDNEGQD